MSKITLVFMQRFMTHLDTSIKNYVNSKISSIGSVTQEYVDNKISESSTAMKTYTDNKLVLKQDKHIIMSKAMAVGGTTVTFTDIPQTGFNMIDIYTSIADLDYTALDDSVAGQLTLTYEAQSESVLVYLKIEVAQ